MNIWNSDNRDSFEKVRSQLDNQCKFNIVLLSDGSTGRATLADYLPAPQFSGARNISIDCDDDGCKYCTNTDHGDIVMTMYAIPEADFVKCCMPDVAEVYGDDDVDVETINDYCDWSKVGECCNKINLAGDYKEEEFTEAKAKNVDDLAMEYDAVKADWDNNGKLIYETKFEDFIKRYPEFYKTVIKTFLKEMGIMTNSEMEDIETMAEYWSTGELIVDSDWKCLFDGAKQMIDGKGHNAQWEKLYKKYYLGPNDVVEED